VKPTDIKIIFFGTPRFAEKILEKLVAAKYNVAAVFTQPDKKIGRKQETRKSPVKELAEKKDIPVFDPRHLENEDVKSELAQIRPDLIVVAAYGKILPKSILEIPRCGAINVHASLLPIFRGASPIQEALLRGEKKGGISLILMSEKLDAGEIIDQEEITIKASDDAITLNDKLAALGGKILIGTIPLWVGGALKAAAQDEKKATYCRLVRKEDGKIDWSEPAGKILGKWKAYRGWPGVFTFFVSGKGKKRLKLENIEILKKNIPGEITGKVVEYNGKISVQSGDGLVILKTIQPEGKKPMSAENFAKGQKFLNSVLG